MILLTAIVACLFLVFITLCLNSVTESSLPLENHLSRDELDNVLWARDAGLKWSAAATTGYSWDRRYEAVSDYRSATAPALESLEKELQQRGIAYVFTYNDSAAREYIVENPGGDAESVGGIIVAREDGDTKIIGCGYDVMLFDESVRFKVTRLKAW
jgi:hypothetical protein